MKDKENIFFAFSSQEYGKMSKKVKNVEIGSYIAEKGQIWWKNKKNNIFWIFSGKYENGSDIDKNGQN